jgi:hypothetical protein
MKPRLQRLLVLLIFLSAGFPLFAQQDTLTGDEEFYLEMRGRVLESKGQQHDEDKKGLDSAEVTVLNERNVQVLFGLTDEKGRLAFRLPLGRKFMIRITKKGFVQKMISVDTYVPAENRKVFVFTFDIDIFEQIAGLDVSVLKQPVARVAYKMIDKNFSYDSAYTNKVNAGLQKMYREYYALKRKENQAADSIHAPVQKVPSGTKKKGAGEAVKKK